MGWQEHADGLTTTDVARHSAEQRQKAEWLLGKVYARYGRLACATLDDETLGRLLFAGRQALSALRDAQTGEKGDTDGPA